MATLTQIPYSEDNFEMIQKKYTGDPLQFGKDLFPNTFERFDTWQEACAELYNDKDKKRLAIASCHSSGKTLLASLLALHRLICYPEARILITSATLSQLYDAFGTTIKGLIEESAIKDWFNPPTAATISLRHISGNWIKLKAWTKEKQESWAGIHCQSPFFIFDECSAIPDAIGDSTEGSMMHEYALALYLGNPLKKTGMLADAFGKNSNMFSTIRVSAYDSTFIDPQWIEDMALKYGRDSDNFRVRVLGEFPLKDSDTFISDVDLREASKRTILFRDDKRARIAGLDIAVSGDKTRLVIRQGQEIILVKNYTCGISNLPYKVEQDLITYKVDAIAIDANGVGAQTFDYLSKSNLVGHMTYRVDFSQSKLTDDREYWNSRTRWWGLAREWIAGGGSLMGANEFIDDLINEGCSLMYTYDDVGRYVLESKKLARKRGVHSPDTFDALAYTFAVPLSEANLLVKSKRSSKPRRFKSSKVIRSFTNYIGSAI